jgi:DNA-binding MarR family transcriptional regulator
VGFLRFGENILNSPDSSRRRIGFPTADNNNPSRSFAARWGSNNLFDEGFVGVPAAFLRYYTYLGLSHSEAMFVLQLMSFKWNEKAPFPSYKTLAQRMGITPEMARRHAKSLEDKNLLTRIKRTGQSNAFDLRLLTEALEAALQQAQIAKAAA